VRPPVRALRDGRIIDAEQLGEAREQRHDRRSAHCRSSCRSARIANRERRVKFAS